MMGNDCRGAALLRLLLSGIRNNGEKHHTFIRYFIDLHFIM